MTTIFGQYPKNQHCSGRLPLRPTTNEKLYLMHPSKLLDGPARRSGYSRLTHVKETSTFIARIIGVIQLKSLGHCNIPIMVSHCAGQIFDYDWEGEDVFVQDKELLVIDEYCVVEVPVQVKKYLIGKIIWSHSSSRVQGVISSIVCVGKIFAPQCRVHKGFILCKAYMSMLDHIWELVGSFNDTFLDVAGIAALVLDHINWSCDVVRFPPLPREVVPGHDRNGWGKNTSWMLRWRNHHNFPLLVTLYIWNAKKGEEEDKQTNLRNEFCQK